MTIQLITQDEYNTLARIYKEHPALTYQNSGYDTLDKSKLTEDDKDAFKTVESILSQSIRGFTKFQNFTVNGRVRFQYNWSHGERTITFIGVGYLKISELLNGFDNPDEVTHID